MLTKYHISNLVYEIEDISRQMISRSERKEIQILLNHYDNNILDLDKAKAKLNSELEDYLKLKDEKRIINDEEMIQFIKEKIKLIDDYKEDVAIKSITLKTSIHPSTVDDFDQLANRPNLKIFYYPGIYKESKNKFNEFIQTNVESTIDFVNRKFHSEFIKYVNIKNNKIETAKEMFDDLEQKIRVLSSVKSDVDKRQLLNKYHNAKEIFNNMLLEERKLQQLTDEILNGRKLTIAELDSILNNKYAGLNFNYDVFDLKTIIDDIDNYIKKLSYVKIPLDPPIPPYKSPPIESIPIQISTSPNDIINKNFDIPPLFATPEHVKAIQSTINTKTLGQKPPLVSPITSPEVLSPVITSPEVLSPVITSPEVLSPVNWYNNLKNLIKTITPNWLENNLPLDSKTAILTGGFVAIFGLVVSGYYGFRQIQAVYKKNSNIIEKTLKRLYNIDSIIGTTILEFIYDGFQNPSTKKQFNNSKHSYNNDLYDKYIGVFYIVNELNDKYKIRLLNDIKRGDYMLNFGETTNEFIIRPVVRIHFIVYNLFYRKQSKEQFIKMLEL